jgi:hypothetical protein
MNKVKPRLKGLINEMTKVILKQLRLLYTE